MILLFPCFTHAGFSVCVLSYPVTSNSLRPHGLQPARLLCPWDFLGKNTGVVCYFLLQTLPDPGIKLVSLALAGGFFTTAPPGKTRSSFGAFPQVSQVCTWLNAFANILCGPGFHSYPTKSPIPTPWCLLQALLTSIWDESKIKNSKQKWTKKKKTEPPSERNEMSIDWIQERNGRKRQNYLKMKTVTRWLKVKILF